MRHKCRHAGRKKGILILAVHVMCITLAARECRHTQSLLTLHDHMSKHIVNSSPRRHAHYLSAGLLLFAGYAGVVTAPLAIGAYTEGDHLTGALSSILSGVETGSLSLVLLVSPTVVRGVPVRTLCWAGLLAAIAGEALSAQLVSFWPLLGVRALVGMGCGSVLCAVTCAVATGNNADRVMAMGLGLAYSLFAFLLPALSEIAKTWGPLVLFLALAVALTSSTIAVGALPRTDAFTSRPDTTSPLRHSKQARPLALGLYLLSVVILSLSLGGIWCFAELVGNQLHLSTEELGFIFSLCSISMIAGCVAAGIVGERFGHTLPAMAGVALGGIGAYGATIASGAATFTLALVVYNISYLFFAPYVVVGIPSQLDNTNRLPVIVTGALWLSYSLGITVSGYFVEQAGFHLLGIGSLAGCMIAIGLLALVATLQREHRSGALEPF